MIVLFSLLAIGAYLIIKYIFEIFGEDRNFYDLVRSVFFLHPIAITIERTILMIVSWVVYLTANNEKVLYLAVSLFIFSALLDNLDGFLARNFDLETKTGRILDPIADKICTLPPLYFFSYWGNLRIEFFWILVVFDLTGDFIVRPLLGWLGISTSSNMWGKVKTVSYFVLSVLCVMPATPQQIPHSMNYLFFLCVVMSGLSFAGKLRKFPKEFWKTPLEVGSLLATLFWMLLAKILPTR